MRGGQLAVVRQNVEGISGGAGESRDARCVLAWRPENTITIRNLRGGL